MSGAVTGILGETLTGTMTFTGNLTAGGSFEYFGTVTLEPSGSMVFNYSGTVTNRDGGSGGTSQNGVMTFYPGTYFKQTVASASYRQVSHPPYWLSTIRSDAPVSITREGSTDDIHGSFSIQSYSGALGNYEPLETGTVDITMEGVLSGSPEGTMTGAMKATARSSNSETDSVVGGPVMAYPDGTLVAELYGGRYEASGRYEVTQGMWIQTSDPNATTFTARFGGRIGPMDSKSPYSEATFPGTIFGFIGEPPPESLIQAAEPTQALAGWSAGTLSGTAQGPADSFTPGGGTYSEISFTIAGVGRQESPEGPLSGQVFANGRVANNTVLFADLTPGTFTIQPQPDGTAEFILNNLWKGADSSGFKAGTATFTLNTAPGIYFEQVAGPGRVTYIPNDDNTVQYTQLPDDYNFPIGTGTINNNPVDFLITDLSGPTVFTGPTSVFPSEVIENQDTKVYTRGVLGPNIVDIGEMSYYTGAMELTMVNNATSTNPIWYRLRGDALLPLSGSNLQGINLVDNAYGPNGLPIQRVLQYQQQFVFPEATVGGQIQAAGGRIQVVR